MDVTQKEIVFQIGLSRAGTQSLTDALRILGYNPIHYWVDHKILEDVYRESKIPFEKQIRDGHDAFLDMMELRLYDIEVLVGTFPNSKFIFLDRDLQTWCRSYAKVEKQFCRVEHLFHKLYEEKMIIKRIKQNDDRTLIMNIIKGDKWEKLCPFLGKEIPSVDFPNKDFTRNEK